MKKKYVVPLLTILLSTFVYAQRGWEMSHFCQWSAEQVESILNGSPWTALIYAGSQPQCEFVSTTRVFYRIRLLTAKPVREALMRQLQLHETTVDVERLRKGLAGDVEAANNIMVLHPQDIRVAGNTQYIVLSVTLREISKNGWEEYNDNESMSGSKVASMRAGACLETSSGRRIALLRYEPPSTDRLGAKLYFQRTLPDGHPLIAPADKELRFKACIDNRPVVASFDLQRMKYHGSVEF